MNLSVRDILMTSGAEFFTGLKVDGRLQRRCPSRDDMLLLLLQSYYFTRLSERPRPSTASARVADNLLW